MFPRNRFSMTISSEKFFLTSKLKLKTNFLEIFMADESSVMVLIIQEQ